MCVYMYKEAGCSASGTPKQKDGKGEYVHICMLEVLMYICMYVHVESG